MVVADRIPLRCRPWLVRQLSVWRIDDSVRAIDLPRLSTDGLVLLTRSLFQTERQNRQPALAQFPCMSGWPSGVRGGFQAGSFAAAGAGAPAEDWAAGVATNATYAIVTINKAATRPAGRLPISATPRQQRDPRRRRISATRAASSWDRTKARHPLRMCNIRSPGSAHSVPSDDRGSSSSSTVS